MPPTSALDWAKGRRLWDKGVSRAAIGLAIGCTRTAVSQYAKRHGWPPRSVAVTITVHDEPKPKKRRAK